MLRTVAQKALRVSRLKENIHRPKVRITTALSKDRTITTTTMANTESDKVPQTHVSEVNNGGVTQQKEEALLEQPLPKLSAQEFRQYNRMAEHMNLFHENFRHTWNEIYSAASSGSRPKGMTIRQLLNLCLEFCHHLTIHHTIEERHIFPVLAKRMDVFKHQGRHLEQHKGIHEGIDKMEAYVEKVKSGESELDLRELKRVMDCWGEVLWTHLDEEVETLGAENMRRYWSVEEIRRMPM